MQPRLLDYYNRELGYLRELGAEFARQHPKVAGRLGMHGIEVADPYVERLLEGFSFLAARIHLKMDAEFPRFSQRLLEVVYPNYLSPMPAMAVVRLEPSMNEGTLSRGFTLARGTQLRARLAKGEQTPCEFATAHALTLWPLKVAHAEMTGVPADLPLARLGLNTRRAPVRSALRLRLEVCGGMRLEDLDLDSLCFYLNGRDVPMQRLLAQVASRTLAVLVHDAGRPVSWIQPLPAQAVRHEGFDDAQSLLPCDARVFQGYRLLQEYFAFPSRYLFFSVNGLQSALRAAGRGAGGPQPAARASHAASFMPSKQQETRAFGLTLLFDAPAGELEGAIGAEHVQLNCTPAINLFPKRADRVLVTPRTHEYHLVVDRTRPMDYEVYSVQRLTGHDALGQAEREFLPFYGAAGADGAEDGAYFSLRREPRLLSDSAQRNGARTGYAGSETYLSLVDRSQAPYSATLRHLSADTLCTNRDLPLLLPLGGASDFTLRVSAPVASIKVLSGPTRPHAPLGEHAQAWRLISHLGLNYLSLTDLDGEQGAQSLREMLHLYADLAEPAVARQIEGLRHARLTPVHHRLPVPGPLVYGRGVRVDLQVDEAAFSGISPYLFGAVLEQFFARHVSLNMMSEVRLSTLQGGELASWKPRMGRRPAV
ncbi:type VI secretion system baseplate subunit TssF [Orrella sp. JC864]|uniref:type VI secretion system baseplate subunit TssF n=1 Tax=Orrella sp. JC864 TaxID=3120298 RepID=UPI0030088AD9